MRNVVDDVSDGDGRQRSLLSPTMASPQLDRHSAPSRIGRGHLPPPPPDVIQSLPASPPDGRTSNAGGEIPPAVSTVNSRRTAESSPRTAPRSDLGLSRRTKARPAVEPAVDSASAHGQQDSSSPVHARYSDTVAHLQEDGFAVCDFPGHMTDDRCW